MPGVVAHACNPSSRVVETGGSSWRKLISEPRVPARDPVSSNKMVSVWRMTHKVDLWPPQVHTWMCTYTHVCTQGNTHTQSLRIVREVPISRHIVIQIIVLHSKKYHQAAGPQISRMICRDVQEYGYTVKTDADGKSITVDTPSQHIMPEPRGRLRGNRRCSFKTAWYNDRACFSSRLARRKASCHQHREAPKSFSGRNRFST